MVYISQVYKDTINNEEYNSEDVFLKCKEEDAKGHIPVVIRWNRRHIKFYVSNDVSIDTILTSFHYPALKNTYDNEKILYLPYNPDHEQYENGIALVNTSSPLKDIVPEKKYMILLWNNQNDRED